MIETQREVNGVIITERVYTMNKVILREQDKQLLIDHANSQKFEVCAMLFGKGNRVKFVYHTDNTDESPVHFTISSEQLMEGYKLAANLEALGFEDKHTFDRRRGYPPGTLSLYIKNL